MNRTITALFVIALVGLFAACAQAANDDASPSQNGPRNYEDVPGEDAHGDINRHGDENEGEGGPHGPIGPGPDDDHPDDLSTIAGFFLDLMMPLLVLR